MSLLPEIFWILLMLGIITATIVAAVKEKKARAAAAALMAPAAMLGGDPGDALDTFGQDNQSTDQFNMDSFK